jgi:hypothetical protein
MASAFQSSAFQSNAFQIDDISVPSTGTGGGGGHHPRVRTMSAAEREAYWEYMRNVTSLREAQAEEEAQQLERAWRKAHGIPEPAVAEEIPPAITEMVAALPEQLSPERSQRITEIMGILAEMRAERLAQQQAEQAAFEQEEDDIAVLMLLAA